MDFCDYKGHSAQMMYEDTDRLFLSYMNAIIGRGELVEVKSLDDSAVVLTCRVWVANADYWPTFFAGNQKLLEELARANITIPFPQLDVHLDKNA